MSEKCIFAIIESDLMECEVAWSDVFAFFLANNKLMIVK